MIVAANSKREWVLAGLLLGLAGPLLAQGFHTLSVDAHTDIWRAGGYNDGSNGQPPASYAFTAAQGQALTFSSVTGTWSCGNGAVPNGPDGTGTGNCYDTAVTVFNPVGPFSGLDMTAFSRPLVGMFLEDSLPASPAPTLRFYWTDPSQGGIQTNFAVLSPQIGQVFFIGDGRTGTGSGAIQVFNVPPTAAHLYLGYVDSCGDGTPGCFNDNSGSMTATFAISRCNFQVSNVNPQMQRPDRAWATQPGIMLSWKSGKSISGATASAIADAVPPATTVFTTDYMNGALSGCAQLNECSISLSDYIDFLSRLGITRTSTSRTVCGLALDLSLYGPMTIVAGMPTPNLVGAKVLTGVTGVGTVSGAFVNYVDPATGAATSVPLLDLLSSLKPAQGAGWPEFMQFPR